MNDVISLLPTCFDDLLLISVHIVTYCSHESEHDKTNMTCAPSQYSDQPAHLPSLIRVQCPPGEGVGPQLPIKRTAKIDQTGQMPRLI